MSQHPVYNVRIIPATHVPNARTISLGAAPDAYPDRMRTANDSPNIACLIGAIM